MNEEHISEDVRYFGVPLTNASLAARISLAMQPRKFWCIDPTDTVEIRMGNFGIAAEEPVTIPQFFKNAFKMWPNVKALCWKDKKEGPWKSLTYTEYKQLVYNVAKSFLRVMYK